MKSSSDSSDKAQPEVLDLPDWSAADDRSARVSPEAAFALCERYAVEMAPGLTPRSVLEKFSAMQMIDVHLPTTDGREVILTRYTQPERDQELLLRELKLQLPEQPPPKIRALVAKAA